MEASKKSAFFARWRSIRVMYLSMFFSSLGKSPVFDEFHRDFISDHLAPLLAFFAGFTIVMASLWPFLLMVSLHSEKANK